MLVFRVNEKYMATYRRGTYITIQEKKISFMNKELLERGF